MNIELSTVGDCTEIELFGNVDEAKAEELGRLILGLSDRELLHVRVDFTKITFMGSAGIGKLLMLYKRVNEVGGEVAISGLPAQLQSLFQAFKLDRLLDIGSCPYPRELTA